MNNVPEGQIVVKDFRSYLAEARMRKGVFAADALVEAALVDIPRNRAITTHGVHVYANLVDFNSVLTDAGTGRPRRATDGRSSSCMPTTARATRSLTSLRCSVSTSTARGCTPLSWAPEGLQNEGERVRTAVAFAAAFREMVDRLAGEHPEFATRVRVGIDSGPAVAIDGGKGNEREPLFVGSPANHAAKLADGDGEGVELSPASRRGGQPACRTLGDKGRHHQSHRARVPRRANNDGELQRADGPDARLEAAFASVSNEVRSRKGLDYSDAVFRFHHKEPPLKDLAYEDHPPSRAVRMELASIFADVDNFTSYIDQAIGMGRIAEAVANLHVIRGRNGGCSAR